MEDLQQDHSLYPCQRQLDQPFRISNRSLDQVDHYLTFKNVIHAEEQSYLTEFDHLVKDEDYSSAQKWLIDKKQDKNSKNLLYTIKHQSSNLYLTLAKGKHSEEYFVGLSPLKNGQGNEYQFWSFGIAQNNRFKIKIQPAQGKIYFLEYPVAASLDQGHKNLLVCRPEASQCHRYLRNWKLSPVQYQRVHSRCEIEHVIFDLWLQQAGVDLIKYFKGKIYTRKNSQYNFRNEQYATSSYPLGEMEPLFLSYPVDVEDIVCIIKVAKMLMKNVVVRSGGHQYCGLSSGNTDTVSICMDRFNRIKQNEDGLVEVQPCVSLKRAVRKFKDWGISLPHGECPLVNIGGHGQTGGYGYFIRSFGLFIDHIQAFDIVLANGDLKRVTRPAANAVITNQEQRLNLELFRGVLGGNAGSFGVVTKYILKGIKDQDHPKSYGFSKIRFFKQQKLRQLMHTYKQWSQWVANKKDNQKLKGLDLQLTIGQLYIQVLNIKMPMLLLEGVYSDPDKGVPYKGQFKQIYDRFMQGQSFLQKTANIFLGRWQGQHPLSYLNYKHVRKFPLVTFYGREIDLPYQKRCNLTMAPLNDQFIDEFVKQASYLADPKRTSLLLVFQTLCGGGVYRDNGNIKVDGLTVTSIPHRNFVHNFVFDIFYNQNADPQAQNQAKRLQQKMGQTIKRCYNAPKDGEKKFFWGSFGDIDMTHDSVVDTYYDSRADYKKLQKLKQQVDPQDVFHTPMTVKLP